MKPAAYYKGKEQTYVKHFFLERYIETVAFHIVATPTKNSSTWTASRAPGKQLTNNWQTHLSGSPWTSLPKAGDMILPPRKQ